MEPSTRYSQEEAFSAQLGGGEEVALGPLLSGSSSSSKRGAVLPFSRADKQESLSLWIPKNISRKECVHFVERPKLSDSGSVPPPRTPKAQHSSWLGKEVCVCGHTQQQHGEEATRAQSHPGKQWNPKTHTQERPTDAFGDIMFTGLGQKVGKYVRVSQDTPPGIIYQLMTQHWGLEVPNLLISVTGGAKDFNMKPRLKSVFRRGLVKVAQTTGAWIITGGTHTGVMKQVGEAVRDSSLSSRGSEAGVVTIGVATWGTIHNRETLVQPKGSFPAEYVMDEEGQGQLTCLDSNHSHFILVDDGTHGYYGVEIPLRATLEKYISEQTKERGGVAIKIPIVCVVLEGGPGTLNTIYNAITNGTPCVVVEGSGRVADVIAQVASLPVPDIHVGLIQQKLGVFFPDTYDTFTDVLFVEWTKKIQDIVRRRQLLTIFREGKDGQQDVDVAILQALLKASRSRVHFGHESWDHQLKLAVAWNRVDIARSEIFTDESKWKPSDLHPMMMAALISNKPDFVRLFLENGVQLRELVTQDALLRLYRDMEPCVFQAKLHKVLGAHTLHLYMYQVAQVLRELLGDFTHPLYPQPENPDRQRLLLPVPHIWLCVKGSTHRSLSKRSSDPCTFIVDPIRDLLIWAIVQNRRELSEIIWAQGQDCIVAALACSKILKELSKEEGDTDSKEGMRALAEEYEQRAIGVFSECHRKDEVRAQKLLTRESEAWGRTTCLQLALEAKAMKFVSHGGIQAFLTKVWWGQLSEDNSPWRIFLCMLTLAVPLLCTGLVSFRERQLQAMTGLGRVRAFFRAPVVVFYLNILSYFAFLCLFAYVLMVDFQPVPSWSERTIYFWLFSLVCEELRQLFYDPDGYGLAKMAVLYFSDFWNKLDIMAILLFIAGLSCRFIPGLLYPGRIILALDFIMFCLRLMHIFTISKTLGPKIIMVKRMMKDVFFFLFLLALWVVSFGVAKQAILIHNESRVDWIFRGVLYQSYLTIYGHIPPYIDVENFDLDHCTPNGTDPYKPKCPESDSAQQAPAFPEWLTVTLLCLYLLFTNILLLNLLIAMFNYTFQQVQEHTDQIWKFQRHHLIEEYQSRPPAPPPLILLSHLHLFIKRVVLKTPARRHQQLKKKLEKNEEAELLSWELYLKESYLQGQQLLQKQRPEYKIQDISRKVDAMMDKLEMDHLKQSAAAEQRLASLEKQVVEIARVLRGIAQTLHVTSVDTEEGSPPQGPPKTPEGGDLVLDHRSKAEDSGDSLHHVNARHSMYPDSNITRFPVPEEKVPWEAEFLIYKPTFHSVERMEKGVEDPGGRAPELRAGIYYSEVDGAVDSRSFHGAYLVKDSLPLNPMGRTGLRGRGTLSTFGPNHIKLYVITRWRRNQDGGICWRNIKKMLEVLVLRRPGAELWALPEGSLASGEKLPQKLREVFGSEFWPTLEHLLNQGREFYTGYIDDPRNTDNAWIEATAVSVHLDDQEKEPPHGRDQGMAIQWQVLDRRLPLYANHNMLLQKVATLLSAYY